MVDLSVYFTDASYSPQYKLGVLGMMKEDDKDVTLTIVHDTKNTQCEIESFISTVEYAFSQNDMNIKIYTDCSNIQNLINKRNIKRDERYQNFYERLDILTKQGMIIKIEITKGHSSKNKKNYHEKLFSIVDKAVRRKLRSIIKKYSLDI